MNSLNEQNLTGRVVVLSYKHYNKNGLTKNPKTRAFLCKSGFGCHSFTIGTAIFGTFLVDGEVSRVEGNELERLATKEESEKWLTEAIRRKK